MLGPGTEGCAGPASVGVAAPQGPRCEHGRVQPPMQRTDVDLAVWLWMQLQAVSDDACGPCAECGDHWTSSRSSGSLMEVLGWEFFQTNQLESEGDGLRVRL